MKGGGGLKKLSVGKIDTIDVDVGFVNISANNHGNNSPLGQNFGQILVCGQ